MIACEVMPWLFWATTAVGTIGWLLAAYQGYRR